MHEHDLLFVSSSLKPFACKKSSSTEEEQNFNWYKDAGNMASFPALNSNGMMRMRYSNES